MTLCDNEWGQHCSTGQAISEAATVTWSLSRYIISDILWRVSNANMCCAAVSVILITFHQTSGTTKILAASKSTQIFSKYVVCVKSKKTKLQASASQVLTKPNLPLLSLVKICAPHTCFLMYSWESLKSELCPGAVFIISLIAVDLLQYSTDKVWKKSVFP